MFDRVADSFLGDLIELKRGMGRERGRRTFEGESAIGTVVALRLDRRYQPGGQDDGFPISQANVPSRLR